MVCSPPAIDRHDAGAQQRDQRRVAGQHAEVALGAGHIDLIDLAGERRSCPATRARNGTWPLLFQLRMASSEWRIVIELLSPPIRDRCSLPYSLLRYASYASAASFLPFSIASSMVPTM